LDKIIADAKPNNLAAIRKLHTVFLDRNAVKKTIEVLVPRYEGRESGFTHTYHLKNRLGDNAPMIRVELVDRKVMEPEIAPEKAISAAKEAKEVEKVK
jgi:large subunit ribosomal protein L17